MSFLALFLGLMPLAQAVPQQLTQQGRLLDSTGSAIDGQHSLTFRLFDVGVGGLPLWQETQAAFFNEGYYTAILGADSANPLDNATLGLYPLYLEIEVGSAGPLSPRQQLRSTPYARQAEQAINVDGGMVNASEISIGGMLIVDSNGSWVGPTASVQWASLQGIPADLADGDDDSLAQLACSAGEIVGWTGSAWACVTDNGLTESEVENFVTNDPLDLASGSMMNGDPLVTMATDQDSLGSLSCLTGDVAKWDAVLGAWACSNDENDQDWGSLHGVPADLADGDNDALGSLSCSNGDVAKFDAGFGLWSCASDENDQDWGSLQGVPADLADGDNDVLGSLNCMSGQVAHFDGVAWTCLDVSGLFDMDGDGLSLWDDCDDTDPASTSQLEDLDCDGLLSADDCDNANPNSNAIADDADCDGYLTADDCDDNDPNSTPITDDADCDGALTANDCDDNDPNRSPLLLEVCGDGIDNDCDGVDEVCFSGPFTFGSCGQTGRFGPSQSQCDSTYLGSSLDGAVILDGNGVQQWTVPGTGTYRITAMGARGGDGVSLSASSNTGASMQGDFELNQGDVLNIVIGQNGGAGVGNCNCGGGGGGGTFVYTGSIGGSGLIIAAGGGGGGAGSCQSNGARGQGNASTSGYQAGFGSHNTTVAANGGSNGSGGNGATQGHDYNGGGGAGWLGGGSSGSSCSGNGGGQWVGGKYNSGHGGFGGGAGPGDVRSDYSHGAGGGGGYSGGGGAYYDVGNGGGGGSYNAGVNQVNVTGGSPDAGQVIIDIVN